MFCDFGAEFTIFDDNGEEPIECFIANITKVGPISHMTVNWFGSLEY